jgi:hypothetical protein
MDFEVRLDFIQWTSLLEFIQKDLDEIADYDTEDEEYIEVSAIVREVERQLASRT